MCIKHSFTNKEKWNQIFVSDLQKGRSCCYANFQTDLKETEEEIEKEMEEKTEEKEEIKREHRRRRN